MQVGGFVIPEGSNVLMSPYYLGRDPQQWGPDAHLYRPERHLPTDPLAATRRYPPTYPHVCSCELTDGVDRSDAFPPTDPLAATPRYAPAYADICWRMVTYGDVWGFCYVRAASLRGCPSAPGRVCV